MRRIATLFVAAVIALPVFGQTGGWSWEAGVSLGLMDRHTAFSEIRDRQSSSTYTREGHTVSYQSHPLVLPTLSVQGGYVIPETPVGVFLGVYCSHASNDLYGGPSLMRERETILHVLPEVRFCPTKRLAPSTGVRSGVLSGLTGVGTATMWNLALLS